MAALELLTLPPEIRLQIYNHLFRGSRVVENACFYRQDDGGAERINLRPPSPLLDVLLSCRTIHDEAIPSFYSLTRFKLTRHNIARVNWPSSDITACFPIYHSHSKGASNGNDNKSTRELVRYVYYAGADADFIRSVGDVFPNLVWFEFDLHWDHLGNDQTNSDRAMKYALRNREWRHAIKDALEQRFPDGMTRAVWDLQKMSIAQHDSGEQNGVDGISNVRERGNSKRYFTVTLKWRLAYRFVEFEGECDLDEWILRVWNADGRSKNVYDIKQDPLFFEMG